jgi:hypothetical protein
MNNPEMEKHSRFLMPGGGPQWIKCWPCDNEDEKVWGLGLDGVRNYVDSADM